MTGAPEARGAPGVTWPAAITEAIAKRELAPATDGKKLARTIEAVLSGSMMTWAHYRQGTAATWMREDLDAVLAPHLVKRRRPSRPSPKR